MPEANLKTKPADAGAGNAIPDSAVLLVLIKKAKKGDQAALYALCARSIQIVYFLALRLVGNETDAEDVMQESLLRMSQKIGKLRDPEMFVSWLSRITANEAREFYRRNAKHGVILDIDDYLDNAKESNAAFLPEEYAENEETREAIVGMIDKLSWRQREAVVLCYYGGLSVTEAAKEMGVDKANVSLYLKLARKKLRSEMEARDLAPAKGTVKLYSMGLSSEMMLLRILAQESGFVPLDNTVAVQTLEKCAAAIRTKAMPTVTRLSGLKGLFTKAAIITVTAATVVTTFLHVGTHQPPVLPASAATEKGVESEIVFSGGEDRGEGNAYLNPKSAHLELADSDGAITVMEWWITPMDDESNVLYRGTRDDGASIEEALTQLREKDGVYVVFFRIRDHAGYIYREFRNFRVGES